MRLKACDSAGMETQAPIWLSPDDRAKLEGWVAGRNTPQKLAWRSRIVLLSANGAGTMAIVRAVGKSKRTVGRWQERYLALGAAGLCRDATRPGRKPPLSAAVIARVVHKTLHEKPPKATHWSIRRMAAAVGLSRSSVQRICPTFHLDRIGNRHPQKSRPWARSVRVSTLGRWCANRSTTG